MQIGDKVFYDCKVAKITKMNQDRVTEVSDGHFISGGWDLEVAPWSEDGEAIALRFHKLADLLPNRNIDPSIYNLIYCLGLAAVKDPAKEKEILTELVRHFWGHFSKAQITISGLTLPAYRFSLNREDVVAFLIEAGLSTEILN